MTSADIEIQEMAIEDIPKVYRLGNELFRGPSSTTLYRTWDAYEVTTGFNQDPELCLVAKTAEGDVVGFVLGTTYQKAKGSWKYGYVIWLGVEPGHQRSHLGSRLYQEIEHRMRDQGVRMILMDTASSNKRAIEFFKRMGFGKPRSQVWMSKVLRSSSSQTNKQAKSTAIRRKRLSRSA